VLLPEYMVPSAFVILESLPLSPNGKLDRKALPEPEASSFSSQEYVAPEGEIEETLAGIWQDILHVERVGRHDNFFDLGGHSLLIIQMQERLRQAGLNADVRSVFNHPTICDLAATLGGAAAPEFIVPANLIPEGSERITPEMLTLVSLDQQQIDHIVATVPGGAANVQDIYPLAPLQEGILFHHMLSEQGDAYILPVLMAFETRKKIDAFLDALQRVIDRHDNLRSAIIWQGLNKPMQVVYRHAALPVEEIRLDAAQDTDEQLKAKL